MMNEITVDTARLVFADKQTIGDLLILDDYIEVNDDSYFLYCFGTDWSETRYRIVIQVYRQLQEKFSCLYLAVPPSLKDSLFDYAYRIGIKKGLIFGDPDTKLQKSENVISIEASNDLKHAFAIGCPTHIIPAESLALLRIILDNDGGYML